MKNHLEVIIVLLLLTITIREVHGGFFDVLIDIPSTLTRAFVQMYDDVREYFRIRPGNNFPKFKRRKAMREIPEREPWPFQFDRPSSINSDTNLIDLSESSSDMKGNLNYDGGFGIHEAREVTGNDYPNRIGYRKNPGSRRRFRGRDPPVYDQLPYVPDNNVLI